ncbi:MAG: helix-turn-helix domain-containing protein [Acidimicrobiales bacterium]
MARHASEGSSWEMTRRGPHPGLAGHVREYCGYLEEGRDAVRRREVASGRVTMILSFGDPIDVAMSNSPSPGGTMRSFVAGLHEGYAITEHDGRQAGIQIDLTPLGAYRLLGVPMSEVANQVVRLDALRGRQIEALTDRLASAPAWPDRFALLDQVFLAWADDGPDPDRSVAWAWRQLEQSYGQVAVGTLAEEIGWSRRHFLTRFRGQVGLAPKSTGRVLRFRRAVDLLTRGQARSIGEAAADSGYADHSHLVREFRILAGCTPSELVAAQTPDGLGVSG